MPQKNVFDWDAILWLMSFSLCVKLWHDFCVNGGMAMSLKNVQSIKKSSLHFLQLFLQFYETFFEFYPRLCRSWQGQRRTELEHQEFESILNWFVVRVIACWLLRLGGMPHKKVCLLSSRKLKVHNLKKIIIFTAYVWVCTKCLLTLWKHVFCYVEWAEKRSLL